MRLWRDFLVDLYLLATKLVDPTTLNLAINELVDLLQINCLTSKDMVAFVYYSTLTDSKLRLLFRDIHIHRMQDSWLTGIMEGTQYPYDFVGEVICRIWHIKQSKSGKSIGATYFKELVAAHYHQVVDKDSVGSAASLSAVKKRSRNAEIVVEETTGGKGGFS